MSPSSIATEPSASPGFFVFSPKRWVSSRASSPTSSVSRARFVSGGENPSFYLPIQRSTVCFGSRRDKRTGEGRVGEEGRFRWGPYHYKKKKEKNEYRDVTNLT